MPIVDACVGLSQNPNALSDYLSKFNQFHVLRIVAVQQHQSSENTIGELNYFQTQAATPGLGGFPNAFVANVDLFSPTRVTELLEVEELTNLRGIRYRFAGVSNVLKRADWERSLDLLVEKAFCLDVSSISTNVSLIADMAQYQPTIKIIVDLAAADNNSNPSVSHRLSRFASLAQYDNVFLKLCGDGIDATVTDAMHCALVGEALDLFGCERVMFASGTNQQSTSALLDRQWSSYVDACSNLSSRYRDRLFRTNAIQVYGL